jgi:RNA polymerase sigma factor (sigma-70 family)
MDTDNEFLAEYANSGSEGAFRELVNRHINLVYSAAVREARGDASLAEDITQAVFTELARQAAQLVSHPALSGWLYTCVRRTAANVRRSEERRQRREQEAFSMNELLRPESDEPLWQEVRPVLDDVMHELDQDERTAVVLRFFEGRSHKEVGAALGVTENAARMRVERSLEKMQGLLSRRGIRSTAATLAAALVAGAVATAPSALAATVASGALATAAVGKASAVPLAKAVAALKTKTVAAGALALAVATLLIWHFAGKNSSKASVSTKSSVSAPVASTISPIPQQSNASALAPSNTVKGPQMAFQLLEAETGAPLQSAKLHLFYLFADGRGKAIKATTDINGRVGIDMPQPPYRALNLFVAADGHVPKVTSFGFRQPMPPEYTMKLDRGVTIGGTVVDPAGQSVAGARVEFDGPGNNMYQAENIQFGPDTVVFTDAKGQWNCNMIPRDYDQVDVTVSHRDYAETNVTVKPAAANAGTLVITLPAGFTISGVVQDSSGNPVEGAKVREVRLNEHGEHTQKTDASGMFGFKGMGPGQLMLAVQANGLAPAVQTLEVTGSVQSLRFQLGPGQLLRGRIVDPEGNPVTNAFVETTRRGTDKIRWSGNTDTNGQFKWDSAPQEPLLYSVLVEGYNRAYAVSLQADGTEHELKLTRYEPDKDTIKITGTAIDAETGLPLDSFKVLISELDRDWAFPLEFETMGNDGKFTFSLTTNSYHPGYQVQIEKEGYLPAASDKYQIKDGSRSLEFKLGKGSGPTGLVLLPNGKPAANADVLLCTSLAGVTLAGPAQVQTGINTTTYRTRTDSDGKFSVSPATEPQGLIIVHDQGYAEVSTNELASPVKVTLKPWGRLEGKLILDSQPAANQPVMAANEILRYGETGQRFGFLRYNFEATTDSDGKFSFDKVPPSQCRVFVSQKVSYSRIASQRKSASINSGETTQVVLGGTGRAVVGKAVAPGVTGTVDWSRVPVELRSKIDLGTRPRREEFASVQEFIAAQERFSRAVESEQRFGAICETDGSFRILDVPAGTYELEIKVRDSKLNSAAPHDFSDPTPVVASLVRDVVVPDDQSNELLALGTLELAPVSTDVSAQK